MKKPVFLKILYAITLLAFHLHSSAQATSPQKPAERFGIDVDAGMAIPTSKNINGVFYTGLDVSIGFKMAVLKNKKLWIKPMAGGTFYAKKANSIDKNVMEAFDIGKAGIELQYKAVAIRRFSFFPVLRADYNWCSNYFSQPYSYNPNSSIQTTAVSEDYLKGTGYSFDAGIMIAKSYWYLRMDYDYFNPTLKVHPDIINAAMAEGIIIPASTTFNCSTVNVGLGINFNFR